MSSVSSRANVAFLDEPIYCDSPIGAFSNEKQMMRALLSRGRVATLQTCKALAAGSAAQRPRRHRPTLRKTSIEWTGGPNPARPERTAS